MTKVKNILFIGSVIKVELNVEFTLGPFGEGMEKEWLVVIESKVVLTSAFGNC